MTGAPGDPCVPGAVRRTGPGRDPTGAQPGPNASAAAVCPPSRARPAARPIGKPMGCRGAPGVG
ncbi:hypothetical protein LK06_007830 [Streptomyces pluripotens]|nr:hypothetical protein LK06_007830 [Streptomyces pluripotens]